jgi:hypothetical protein
MADENKVTIGEMIHAICEANSWRAFGQLPGALQWFYLNVKPDKFDAPGLGVISEAQYEREHPEWVAAMREDYAAILVKRETDAKAAEAAKLAESEGVKWLNTLTAEQRAKLLDIITVKEAAPVADVETEVVDEAKPVMAMCEKCGKEMPMMEAKKGMVDGENGHDMVKVMGEPEAKPA